jgi:hypothetical protein
MAEKPSDRSKKNQSAGAHRRNGARLRAPPPRITRRARGGARSASANGDIAQRRIKSIGMSLRLARVRAARRRAAQARRGASRGRRGKHIACRVFPLFLKKKKKKKKQWLTESQYG